MLGRSKTSNIFNGGHLTLNGGVVILDERLRILNILGGRHNTGIVFLDGVTLTQCLNFGFMRNAGLDTHVKGFPVDTVSGIGRLGGHHRGITGLNGVPNLVLLDIGDCGTAHGPSDSEKSVLSVVL